MRFLEIPPEKIQQALASWQWLPLGDKQPIRVTVFGDVFLGGVEGIYFLDTIEGSVELVCNTEAELDSILATDEGAERYLLATLAAEARAEGIVLGPNECLNFKLDPVVGGALDVSNVAAGDFVVAINVAGQLHEQVRGLNRGTPLTIKLAD